jgi:hypothetical protein
MPNNVKPNGRRQLHRNGLWSGLVFAGDPNGIDYVSGVPSIRYGNAKHSAGPFGADVTSPSTSGDGVYWPVPTSLPNALDGTTEQTIVAVLSLNNSGAYALFLGIPSASTHTSPYQILNIGRDNATANMSFNYSDAGTLRSITSVSFVNLLLFDNAYHVYGVTRKGATVYFYRDGILCTSASITNSALTAGTNNRPVQMLEQNYSATGAGVQGGAALGLIFNKAKSESEHFQIAKNLFGFLRQRDDLVFAPSAGGGAQDLAGAAAGVAAATGAVSLSVPVAGAGVSVATATGALSLSLPLAGSATAVANATGGLSLSIPLQASAIAQAAGSGALSINVTLSGAAIAQAAASAGLTVVSSGLQGAATALAAATGSLTHIVPLAGAALTVASATGAITQMIPLAGAAASASTATGGLDVNTGTLSGAAIALATAGGALTLRINLDGAAIANAIAVGALAGTGLLTATPGWQITARARTWRISA